MGLVRIIFLTTVPTGDLVHARGDRKIIPYMPKTAPCKRGFLKFDA